MIVDQDLRENVIKALKEEVGFEKNKDTRDIIDGVIACLETNPWYLDFIAALLGVGERFNECNSMGASLGSRELYLQFLLPDATPASIWPNANRGSAADFLTKDHKHDPITQDERMLKRLNDLFPSRKFSIEDLRKIETLLGVKS